MADTPYTSQAKNFQQEIGKADERGAWPLSFQERQLAAAMSLRPDSAAYNAGFALKLSGALDEQRLERSLNSFVQRHRVMRSRYLFENGHTVRRVSSHVPVVIGKKTCLPEDLHAAINSAGDPFDLTSGPLFRFFLISAGNDENILLLRAHHIVMDGLSFGLFIRDLRELYENGGEYSSADDSPDYLDYAVWQDERDDSGESADEGKKFFIGMFEDGAPKNDMPSRVGRPADIPAATAREERLMDVSRLKESARERGETIYRLLFAAFGLTLAKYCGSCDVTVGAAMSGRSHPQTTGMFGTFANILPVRIKIGPDEKIDAYINSVSNILKETKYHQDFPADSLTPLLAPEWNEPRNPVFDAVFNHMEGHPPSVMDGLTVEALPRPLQGLHVDLCMETTLTGDELRAALSYSPELYDADVISDILDLFSAIAGRIPGAPEETTAAGLSELPDAHRRKILEDFAGRRSSKNLERTVIDLFRDRAMEAPARRAVLFENMALSYGELDATTDALAFRLLEMGVSRGDWAGLLIRRSEMMPVCALGALKAGAGYVPLDPTYPSDRLEFMLRDSGVKTVVADPGLEVLIPNFSGTILSAAEIRTLPSPPSPLPAAPEPGDPFVLLYTSGTTGQPKGVILSHANLANFCLWLTELYGMTSGDLVAAYASFGFDACMMDMYPALTTGAAMDIIPENMRLDLPRIDARFREKGVTIAFMTTQLGRQFAADTRCPSLRILTVGGETLVPIEPPASFTLYNGYGPTECTIISSIFRVDRLYERVPLGKPPQNTAVYILDKSGRLAPVGTAGELCIAGLQVGLGYLNRPELTAEKFARNPFSDEAGFSRMYRTGDVARFLPGGDIDFIGRSDFQVKIRGFRVELPEIELRLRAHPNIKDAAVIALDAPGGGKRAVAYVVADSPDKKLEAPELGRFIEEELPTYMVPSAIMQVDAIPLNPNGKVDRRKLPPPAFGAQGKPEAGVDRPANDLEMAIAETLKEILGHGQFNSGTNLFRAGLTSLSAIRFCARLDERLGAAPSVPELIKSPTPLDIENAVIRRLLDGRVSGEAPDDRRVPGETVNPIEGYPLSESQLGVYFDCMKRPGSTVYNLPFRLSFARVNAGRLARAAAAVIKAHPAVNSRIAVIGGEARQLPLGQPMDIPCLEAGCADMDEIAREFVKPFDLSKGPLCRARVYKTPGGTVLLADFHHIAFDGTSLDVFLRELGHVYEDEEFLRKHRPAREKISCFDWAVREKKSENSAEWLDDKDYFDGQLAGFGGASEIPGDLPRDGKKDIKQESVEACVVMPVDRASVESFSREHGATPAGLFLAALAYALGRWIYNPDVALVTISNGRSEPGLANSFGMFVRTLPLVIRSKGEREYTSLDFVRLCQETLSNAVLHEKYPFTRISQEYGFEPSVMYACQIGLMEERKVGGETAAVEFMDGGDPMFKISVFAEERGGDMACVVRYDASLYSSSLMNRFAESVTTALANITAKPDGLLSRVSLASDSAREQLAGFNRTDGDAPETTLVAMFNDAVRRNPGKTALIAADGEYTFEGLNERANRIANALLALGVKKEDRIAFILRRTSRVIASMFGILKAGCAYIPIDPDYPAERIEHVLNDSGAKYLLATPGAGAAGGKRVLDFDSLLESAGGGEPDVSVTPDMLAYLLFTSGSTGKPKGVMIEHRGIANFITDDERNDYVRALVRGDCLMMSITTIAFDMFGIETLLTLCNGLTTVLADDESARDPARLAELFQRTGANAIDSTPTRILEYSEYPPLLDALRNCKVIVLGGEKYPAVLLERLKKGRKSSSGLFNIYGPTEISIACNNKDLSDTDRITVGPPLLNVHETVVDSDGNALPPGIVGELWVGGRGVGRGYINRPEQTAERFVEYGGERAYKCGDFARWTDSGEIEILGRNDNQIKLRGLRIELGEIESAITSIEGVKAAVAMIKQLQNSDHICAYYVADSVDPGAIREHLAKVLTPYMIPTAYLRMDAIPKTPNGKIDARSLPEPELLKTADYEAPKTALEEAFCSIFASALGIEKAGAKDSFFEAGGSSLAVTRVIIEAKERGLGGTGASISYADVFAHPTPRELAALLAGGGSGVAPPEQIHAEQGYDYGSINALLARGTIEAFRTGPHRPLGNVLLTGATGFLGAHILRVLLEEGDGAVTCLTRKGGESAEDRLKNMLFYYFEDDFSGMFGGRLRAANGDITRPETLNDLADLPFDTIINSAANVTHFAKDSSIADVNTGGTLNLIDLAMSRGARLVHMSTMSVAGFSVDNSPPKGTMLDETELYLGQNLENQYIHSKFMAERAILEAIPQGLDAKIMRLGNLMARNRDGEFQINAQANSFLGSLRAYLTVGCFPYSACLEKAELSPIDSAAKAILLLADASPECVVFHPFSNYSFYMGDIMEAMRDEGLRVDLAEDDVFERALAAAMRDKARAEKLVSLIAYQNVAQGKAALMLGAKNDYTSQALLRRNWRWPEASGDYLRAFLRGMIELGYFGDNL